MSTASFRQFLKRNGVYLFFASTEMDVPGRIIQKTKRGFKGFSSLDEVLPNPERWQSEIKDANIVNSTLERTVSLEGKASLKEFGIQINGGLASVKKVTWKISEVTARVFSAPVSRVTLLPELHNLKYEHNNKWKLINGCFVAEIVFYAKTAEVTFEADRAVDLSATLPAHLKVSGEAEVKWKSKRSFELSSNESVPFGFTGAEI